MWKRGRIGYLCLALMVGACGDSTGTSDAQIMGVVTDSLTTKGVPAVLVAVGDMVTTSSADGHYRLDLPSEGSVDMTASADGYETAVAHVLVTGRVSRDIQLHRLAPFIANRIDNSLTVIDLQGARSIDWSNWTLYYGTGGTNITAFLLHDADVSYPADTTRALVTIPASLQDRGGPVVALHDTDHHLAYFDCPASTGNCTEVSSALY